MAKKCHKAVPVAPLLVPINVAALILGVGRDAIYGLIKAGELRTVSIGQIDRIPTADIHAFVERNAKKTGIDPARQARAKSARAHGKKAGGE